MRLPRSGVPVHSPDEGGGDLGEQLVRRLGEPAPEEAVEAIADQVSLLLAEVLRRNPATLDRHRRTDQYGTDSLTGAELLVSTRRRFDVDIPPLELLRGGGSIADIAELVHLRLGLRRPERTSS